MQFQDLVRQKLNQATENVTNIINHAVSLTAFVQDARSGNKLSYNADHNNGTAFNGNATSIDAAREMPIELF